MIKKAFFSLSLLIIMSCVIAIMIEGLFRMFPAATGAYYPVALSSPGIFVDSPEGYSLLPNSKVKHYSLYGDYIASYTINSSGFRANHDYSENKTDNSRKICILGDSFVFGIGVNDEQTLAACLEKDLLIYGRHPELYSVFNLGVTGYTFDNSYVRLKRYCAVNPDIVIFVVFGGNDFSDILSHEWVFDKDKDIIEVKESARHINSYHRFVNGPRRFYEKENVFIENIREFLRNNSVFYTYLGTLRYRNKVKAKTNEDNIANDSRGLVKAKQILDRFFVLMRDNKFKVLFILYDFDDSRIKEEFTKYLSGKTSFIMDLSRLKMNKESYLPRDGHWSASGNSYIADLIFGYLKNNNML